MVSEGGLERSQSAPSDTRGLYKSIHQLRVPIKIPHWCPRPCDELSNFLCRNWVGDKAVSSPSIPAEVDIGPSVLVEFAKVPNSGEAGDSNVTIGGPVVDPDPIAFTDVPEVG